MPDDLLASQQLTALDALNALGKPPGQEAISDLLTALQHFSDARGYDFNDLLAAAQAKYRTHLSAHGGYKVGDQVRLLRWANESGTIVRQTADDKGNPLFHVYVTGASQLRAVRPEHIEPAAPYPATKTPAGPANNAGQAELRAVELLASSRRDGLPPPDKALQLINDLAAWSGKKPQEVEAALEPKIHLTIAAATPSAGRLTAENFPVRPQLQPVPEPAGEALAKKTTARQTKGASRKT